MDVHTGVGECAQVYAEWQMQVTGVYEFVCKGICEYIRGWVSGVYGRA